MPLANALPHACSHAQLGKDTGSCQPRVNPEVGDTGTVHNQDASMDMPLENIVHIEDVCRTTLVATILEVVAGRLDRLGFGSMRLQMAIVKYTPDTEGLAGLDHEAPEPNLGCADEVLT